jgi:hypothetical protein
LGSCSQRTAAAVAAVAVAVAEIGRMAEENKKIVVVAFVEDVVSPLDSFGIDLQEMEDCC